MDAALLKKLVSDAMRAEFDRSRLADSLSNARPVPVASEAEDDLMTLLLCGLWDETVELPGIADLYDPWYRHLFIAIGVINEAWMEVTVDRVVATIRASGVQVSDEDRKRVVWLRQRECANGHQSSSIRQSIIESSRARKMIAWLQAWETELRLGKESVDSVSSKMLNQLAKRSPSSNSPSSSASTPATATGSRSTSRNVG